MMSFVFVFFFLISVVLGIHCLACCTSFYVYQHRVGEVLCSAFPIQKYSEGHNH